MTETLDRPLSADEETIETRRAEWFFTDDGYVCDPATSSLQWRKESVCSNNSFAGAALYLDVRGNYFVHVYGQWDRFCSVKVGLEEAIKATLTHKGQREARQIFGRLHERGQGAAFTPVE